MDNLCHECKYWNKPDAYDSDFEDSECHLLPPTPVFSVAEHRIVMVRSVVNGRDLACSGFSPRED